ncbi:hypothetical protein CASFOL_016642 [Castilleja foliolosa]|uniref:J domain-containing protein n=1 Tax=Castilleja foliolosa TaxID=1961234 RepID=A0ABD3D8U6_9LAMI
MGGHSRKSRHRKYSPEPSTSTSATSSSSATTSSSDDQLESSSKLRKRRRDKDRNRDREENKRSKKSRRENNERSKKTNKKHSRSERVKQKRRERKKRKYDSDEESESGSDSELENPEDVVKFVLKEFPTVAGDLEQLLRMIDDGQAVDIRGLSEKSLVKHLRRLFKSLNLKENGVQVFLLPHKASPTMDIIGPIIRAHLQPEKELDHLESQRDASSVPPVAEKVHVIDNVEDTKEEAVGPIPIRRKIGPEMPSAELLAAAAKLTEAEAELREAELDGDDESFIGPPPPAVVKEAESSNEAERFEEITRIIGADEASPYDILGVNNNMAAENMKKRYWKLSLMVHPDKSSHPQAQQAFVKLNKAFKDLQDPDKRKVLDDKIKLKEEQDAFKAELKAMREAAQWRRLQGISMEGDDLLLAEMDAKAAPKRDEWMTTLPPERKPGGGVPTHSTRTFSKTAKEGRGDTSAWTDTPSERAQKAKMNYLEAYNEAAALASNEQEKKRPNPDAELVDQYNKAKRSKSLMEKHQESAKSRVKKKSKEARAKEEWEESHPWKPWDREKDLTAGRLNVKLDNENMAQGLTSRFSSGNFQRNFL